MKKIMGYDDEGYPMHYLSPGQTIAVYLLLAIGIVIASALFIGFIHLIG